MNMDLLSLLYLVLGLVIGSFLNVCIYRLPAAREEFYHDSPYGKDKEKPKLDLTISKPRHSICPACKNKLLWHHNIPALSWIYLRGRCAFCKSRISIRYPAVEIITGIISLFTFTLFGLTPTAVVIFLFACSLLVIAFIDYDYYIIPNVISLPGTVIAFGLIVINHFTGIFTPPIAGTVIQSLLGVAIGAGFLWIVAEFYLRVRKIEGLGMGDVKLLAMTGALLGPQGAFYTIFVGSVFGAICGILLILVTRRKASQHIPFGPYLVVATLLYLYTGNLLIDWWVGFVVGDYGGAL